MKKSLLSACLIMAITLVACSKKTEEKEEKKPVLSPVLGYWQGEYTTTGQLGKTNYALLVNANGSARVYDLDMKTDTNGLSPNAKVDGQWVLSGSHFQLTYKTGTKMVNTSLIANEGYTAMAGTWAFDTTIKGNMKLAR